MEEEPISFDLAHALESKDYETIKTAFTSNPDSVLSSIIHLHEKIASHNDQKVPEKQVEKKNERELVAELRKKQKAITTLKVECDKIRTLISKSTPMDLPKYFTGDSAKLGEFLDAVALKHGTGCIWCDDKEACVKAYTSRLKGKALEYFMRDIRRVGPIRG